MNNVTVLGIDLAKDIFQLHGVDKDGKEVFSKKLRRNKLAAYVANFKPCLIGMEACGGSHYWSRCFRDFGHDVKMMSPQFVKPYVKGNKNDANDAQACCEAVTRPSMRFVPIKTIEQQDIQLLHRVRSRLISQRTALTNQIRGLLAEYGIVVAKSIASLRRRLPEILDEEVNELTVSGKEIFQELYDELCSLTERIDKYEQKVKNLSKHDERCKILETIPGIGKLTSTAFVAAVGNAEVFDKGRQLSAWLGLVPKEHSSGGKTRLLGISKRGDRYLRSLFVHGGRSVVKTVKGKTDRHSLRIQKLIERCGVNKTVVAISNRNVRIAWALLKNNTIFDPNYIDEKSNIGVKDVKKAA